MSVEEYSWGKTSIYFAGKLLINVESASYKLSCDSEVFYGNEGEPTGYGRGEIKGEGEVEVSGQEYVSLVDFAVTYGYNLLKMPPIPLIITEESEDLPTMKHVLTQVIFKEIGFSGKNKDKRFLHKLPFTIVGPVQILK